MRLVATGKCLVNFSRGNDINVVDSKFPDKLNQSSIGVCLDSITNLKLFGGFKQPTHFLTDDGLLVDVKRRAILTNQGSRL